MWLIIKVSRFINLHHYQYVKICHIHIYTTLEAQFIGNQFWIPLIGRSEKAKTNYCIKRNYTYLDKTTGLFFHNIVLEN
jgi:hypothetical protein